LILVIDEYPYLASGNSSIASILQKAIDQVFLQSQLFLILCGSSMSFMETKFWTIKAPCMAEELLSSRSCRWIIGTVVNSSSKGCCHSEFFNQQRDIV